MNEKLVHKFADKWFSLFNNKSANLNHFHSGEFLDDCRSLGFELDYGRAFRKRYGSAFVDCEELSEIINSIDDISLLGSAIYSRYYMIQSDRDDVLEMENCTWFLLALSRLMIMTEERIPFFQGIAQKAYLVSNNVGFGPRPDLHEEIEQHLIIERNGKVEFDAYNIENDLLRQLSLSMNDKIAQFILDSLGNYFSENYETIFVTDIGSWSLALTNEEGTEFYFGSSLITSIIVDNQDICDLIRKELQMPELFLFDGKCKTDQINRIEVSYYRIKELNSSEYDEGIEGYPVWEYSERLIIDRRTQSIEIIQYLDPECKITRKYEIEGEIDQFLDFYDADSIFSYIEGNPDDIMDLPNEKRDYIITLEFEKNPPRTIKGSYDKLALPEDYPYFIEDILSFIRFYGLGEMFYSDYYGRPRRRTNEYVYCSVQFTQGGRSYYYLYDNEDICTDDFVFVPVGDDNHIELAKVANVEFFSKENAPYPVEKTKSIIRKCTEEDFEELLSDDDLSVH